MTGHAADDSPIEAKLAAPPLGGLQNQTPESEELGSPVKPRNGKLQSRVAVLSILFLVTGAIGVPLLWMNPNFSRTERVLWTVVVSLYTLSLLAVFGGVVWWLYQRLIDLGVV
jgi:hypothetical protein